MIGIFAPDVVVYTRYIQLRTVYHFKRQLEMILAGAGEDSADQVVNGQKIGGSQPPGFANSEDVEKAISTTQEVAVGPLRPAMYSVSDGINPVLLPDQRLSSSERAPIDTPITQRITTSRLKIVSDYQNSNINRVMESILAHLFENRFMDGVLWISNHSW